MIDERITIERSVVGCLILTLENFGECECTAEDFEMFRYQELFKILKTYHEYGQLTPNPYQLCIDAINANLFAKAAEAELFIQKLVEDAPQYTALGELSRKLREMAEASRAKKLPKPPDGA